MSYLNRGLVALAASGAAAWSTPAAAQTAHPETAQLGEVIVTAQRRPEAERNVPIALSVIGREALRARRIDTFGDLAPFVPGLTVQSKSASDSTLVLRGISNADGSSFQEPRVSVFQDGAPMSKARGAFVELFDLEGLEVARGPQTTLFGRNALTGAVNIIQNKASRTTGLALNGEWGNRGHVLLEGAGNLMLTDSLSVRLALRTRDEGGVSNNLLDGGRYGASSVTAGRLTLSWRPVAQLTSHVILNAEQVVASGQPTKSATFRPSQAVDGASVGDLSLFTGATLAAGPGFDGGRRLGLDRRVLSGAWLTNWTVAPGLAFASTTSWRSFESYEAYDFDGFVLPLLTVGDDSYGKQLTQDFRANFDQ
jgi:iron complex outermembrane receptor protein